ncbi:MAG: ABC transporter permease subunit [Spirochaetia bacterium]|jgi:NitT/TauT family transport system permease protein
MKRRRFQGLLGIAALLVLWEVLSLLVPGGFIPDPLTVCARLLVLLPRSLWRHILVSLGRITAGLAAALLLAVPAGLALGRVQVLDRVFSPAAYLLYPVPKIALLPVIMLLFGLGNMSKVLIVFLVLFFQVLVATRDAARSVPAPYLLSMRSLGARRVQTFRYLLWPALLPALLSSLRIGTGTALAVLFFAETFGTSLGLGWFVMESWMRVSYVDMFAGILALGLLGLGLFFCIDLAQKRLCRWQAKV